MTATVRNAVIPTSIRDGWERNTVKSFALCYLYYGIYLNTGDWMSVLTSCKLIIKAKPLELTKFV